MDFLPVDEVSRIRDRLGHPVVDGDGHLIEVMPLVRDFVRETAGDSVAESLVRVGRKWVTSGEGFLPARGFNVFPAKNTLDRMTATLPALLYRRLDEIGLDFALLYPTFGLVIMRHADAELRQAAASALNRYYAELYGDFRDRLEPVAVIPTFTPDEAIVELDHAVGTLGLKAVVMSGVIPRSVRPDGTPAAWVDTLGHESLYDYDPVWAKCTELGVVPAFHGVGFGWGSRVSSKNYVYNHLGNFAAAQEATCRSLLMAGVPKRFPGLRFTFLEGGSAWACQLYADLLGHYEKRNRDAVKMLDDAELDFGLSDELFATFARGRLADVRQRFAQSLHRSAEASRNDPLDSDDFAESLITGPDDIMEMFTRSFYFGCEADDPMNALAFNRALLPLGARLNAVFASDIGHWDVPDVRLVLAEAWELVEDGHLDEDEFRDFTCGNIIRMLTDMNPRFFDGTVISAEASRYQPALKPTELR